MNEPSSPLRAAAIDLAAREIETGKLQVLDRDWRSGAHHLDLVATPGAGILAAVEVRDAAPAANGASLTAVSVTAVSEHRVRRLAGAAREWMRGNDDRYDDLWLVIVTVSPCAPAGDGSEVG